jgi:hypothetical protein
MDEGSWTVCSGCTEVGSRQTATFRTFEATPHCGCVARAGRRGDVGMGQDGKGFRPAWGRRPVRGSIIDPSPHLAKVSDECIVAKQARKRPVCAGRQGGARAGACRTVTVSGGSLAVRARAGRMPDTKVPVDRPSASGDADPTRLFASRSRAREWWQGRTRREGE